MEYIIELPNKSIDSQLFSEQNPGKALFMRDDKLIISGAKSQQDAQALIDAHIVTEPTITEKLESVGLSIDDLKAALGL